MKAFLRWLFRPLFQLFLKLYRPEDDWEEIRVHAPAWQFGRGSRQRFSWYFEGESSVVVSSVEEVVEWLAECEYVSDKDLFQEDDFWQHPRTLERLRRGDCEDLSLWGWRKLNELGVSARLFVGRRVIDGAGSVHGHAWVVYETEEGEMLLEATSDSADHIVRTLAESRSGYRPHFSVDGRYRTMSYCGWLTSAKEDLQRKKRFGRVDITGT